jgi:pimeloyl-ACP methyl ester carboxylesterase
MTVLEITFESANRRLHGRLFGHGSSSRQRRALLFVHGQGSSQHGYQNRAAAASQRLDAVCLTFDLSGHGEDAPNLDRYSINDHLQDVIAGYDFLVSHQTVDPTRIGVCGASYGGLLSILLTDSRHVKRLLLRAPSLVGDAASQGGRPAAVFDPLLRARKHLDSLAALAHYQGSVLIVESEKDEVIPHANIEAYLRSAPGSKLQVIPNATHALTNPVWDAAFVTSITSWFKDL